MFDGKTVTAVFVSLAVIAVLTSGQQLSTPNDLGNASFDLGNILPSGEATSFENRPEPNNTVEAEFNADLKKETLELYNTNITSEGLTEIESEGINSDSVISIQHFTGTIHLQNGNEVRLIGDAEGYTTSGVTSGDSFSINESHTTNSIDLQTVKFQHTFNHTDGRLENPKGQSSDTAETVHFNSFTGNLIIDLENQNIEMNGKVDRLQSGSFVIN